ncbi:hypothetical protein ACEWY4_017347 [Coilia grayii]|uniref:Ig-like domain-containing protein n=1 Tax=Coilia grayii TaxID=363190 RepID=A0ABD1JGJ9_9TELE
MPSVSINPPGDIQEGTDVTLTCTSRSWFPVQSYSWHKTGSTSALQESLLSTYTITGVTSVDSGEYYCQITDSLCTRSSAPVKLQVVYKPKNTSVVTAPPGVIHKGGTVTLTCSSDANPPVENYTWFKVDQSTPVGSGQQYSISNISSEDAGQYYCEARNEHGAENSSAVSITVKDKPKNTSAVTAPPGVIHKGGTVTLTCSSDANPPVENYTWFKVNQSTTPVGSGQQYSISNIRSKDGGQYYCEARNEHGAEKSSAVSIRVKGISASLFLFSDDLNGDSPPQCIHVSLIPLGGQSPVLTAVVAVLVCGVVCLLCVLFFMRCSLNPNTTQPDDDYQSLNPNTLQPEAVYQSLNPNTTQPDAVYESLNPNNTQPDVVYQSLNLNTTEPDAVYQTLNPNNTQPDDNYQSLNPNTTQPDEVYQSLNPNTTKHDDYQSLNPNTIQPDPVYQTLSGNAS